MSDNPYEISVEDFLQGNEEEELLLESQGLQDDILFQSPVPERFTREDRGVPFLERTLSRPEDPEMSSLFGDDLDNLLLELEGPSEDPMGPPERATDLDMFERDLRKRQGQPDPGGVPTGIATGVIDAPRSIFHLVERAITGTYNIGSELVSDVRGTEYEDVEPTLFAPFNREADLTEEGQMARAYSETWTAGMMMSMLPMGQARLLTSVRSGPRMSASPVPAGMQIEGIKSARAAHFGGIRAAAGEGLPGHLAVARAQFKPASQIPGGRYPSWYLDVMKEAAHRPASFAALEATSLTGAAGGAALAETWYNGSQGPRMVLETLGGLMNLPVLAAKAGKSAIPNMLQFARDATSSGNEIAASNVLRSLIEESGGDPAAAGRLIERALRADKELGLPEIPAGYTINNDVFNATAARVASVSSEFSGQSKAAIESYFQSAGQLISRIAADGSPEALRHAAAARVTYFENFSEQILSNARATAAKRMREVSPATSPEEARRWGAQFSEAVGEELRKALQDARSIERSYYEAIPSDISVPGLSGTRKALNNIARDRSEEQLKLVLPAGLLATTRRYIRGESEATVGNMITLRSDLMDQAAELSSRNRFKSASAIRRLADGIKTDIDSLDLPEVTQAREFSSAFNDAFTRGYTARATASGRDRDLRISPEDMLDDAMRARTDIARARNFQDMEESLRFLNRAYGLDGPEGNSVVYEQEMFVRSLAAEYMREDGTLDSVGLARFVRENATVLDAFPTLREHLSNAENAAQMVSSIERRSEVASKGVMRKSFLGQLIGANDPATVVRDSLQGPDPVTHFRDLARLAKRGGEEAVAGLQLSMINAAEYHASRGSTTEYWRRYSDWWSNPIRRGLPSPRELAETQGVFDADQLKRIDTILDRTVEVELAYNNPKRVDELLEKPSRLQDFSLSMIGTRLGTSLAKKTGVVGPGEAGPSLMIAGRSAGLMRQVFGSDVLTRRGEIIHEMIENPRMLKDAMKRTDEPYITNKTSKQFNSYLLGALIPQSTDWYDDVPEMWFDEEDTMQDEGAADLESILKQQEEQDAFDLFQERSIAPL